jgi:hypothetical protein
MDTNLHALHILARQKHQADLEQARDHLLLKQIGPTPHLRIKIACLLHHLALRLEPQLRQGMSLSNETGYANTGQIVGVKPTVWREQRE